MCICQENLSLMILDTTKQLHLWMMMTHKYTKVLSPPDKYCTAVFTIYRVKLLNEVGRGKREISPPIQCVDLGETSHLIQT